MESFFDELHAARYDLQVKVRAAIEQGDDAELEKNRGSAEVVCGRIEPGIADGRPQFERALAQGPG